MKILTIALFVVCLTFSSSIAFEGNGIIEKKDNNIKGILIGDSYSKVIKKLGKPLKEKKITNPYAEGKPIHLYYDGLYVYIGNNEVMNIKITKTIFSIKGIVIGNNLNKVLSTFGKAKLKECGSKKCLRYNVKNPNGMLSDEELIFLFENNKIIEIRFLFPFT